MKIAISSDHRGYHAKEQVKHFLRELGHDIVDYGCDSPASCDYPDTALVGARAIAGGQADRGIFFCGTGIGMSIAVACAIVPLFVGAAPLTSFFFEADLPVLGHVEFVTSTLFDIGVYLVVIGLVLDVLRSLGAEVDRQALEAGEGHRPEVTVS